ncbi:cytochrome C [Marixanthomonas spongiae]|uniref:Cytochrome C n=1 Tax=Marixanthomonas spongiae TaxID=2174845 RepID=A0A2U0I422_9FLAO|nr:cytochrome C [Marixanthomonas spongiae]PVW15838.1 cytochrome C [Marixanthomonas spongiae]
MEDNRNIKVFLDDDPKPFASFAPPVKIVLDTTKIPDGKHTLTIVAKSSNNVEGIRKIPFVVRNGPEIAVVGLKENETVDSQIPITINAYGSETEDFFVIRGSETPKAIPAWVWALVIIFVAYGLFYLIMYWSPELYKSFF